MALVRAMVPVPLGVGINQKVDPQQLPIGKLSVLENGVFNKLGRIDKRFGQTSLGSAILGSEEEIDTPREVMAFKNELVMIDSSSFYSRNSTNEAWIKRAEVTGASAKGNPVVRNTNAQKSPDCAHLRDIIVYAWEDSSGGIRASSFDVTTNQSVVSDILISATGIRPKVSATPHLIYIHYIDGQNLNCRTISPEDPHIFTPELTLASNAHGLDPIFDVVSHGEALVLAYQGDINEITVGYIRRDGNFATLVDGFPVPVNTGMIADNALCILSHFEGDPNHDAIYLFAHHSMIGLQALIIPLQLIDIDNPIIIDNTTTEVRQIGAVLAENERVRVFYSFDANPVSNRFIKRVDINRDGQILSPRDIILRSVDLYSKPWFFDGEAYFICSFDSPLQATYFTASETGKILNRISYQNGGGHRFKKSHLASPRPISDNKFICPTLIKTQLRSETGHVYSLLGVQATTIDFDTDSLFQSVEIGNNLLFSSGMLLAYDGINVTELGFNVYPEGITLASATGGAHLQAGTYTYFVVYEWTDQQGQIHRSAPSPGATITIASGVDIFVTIPTLRLTSKPGVSIAVYRTKNGGVTAYRVSSLTNPTLNNLNADTVTFTDTLTDAQISGNEILYTTGGVLDNIPPPSAKHISKYNNRVVLTDLEDPNDIWFSKTYSPGLGVAFNDAFSLRIDQGRLGISGSGVIGQSLVFFKQNEIYYTSGQGPTDTGSQYDYTIPQFITGDVGCMNGKTITTLPIGLLFKSSKGWYVLDQGMQAKPIGLPVEDFNPLQVSSVTLIEDQNQIRITHENGVALIYDYLFDQWGTFTNYNAVSSINVAGNFILAKTNGEINREDKDSYFDNGTPIRMRLVTPWLSLNKIQGFMRIYQAIVIGNFRSAHRFVVNISYDFDTNIFESLTIDTVTALGQADLMGNEPFYGFNPHFGGIYDAVWQFKIKPRRQKCEAVRFELFDLNPDLQAGAGYSISGMLLDVGGKQGLFKVPTRKIMQTR